MPSCVHDARGRVLLAKCGTLLLVPDNRVSGHFFEFAIKVYLDAAFAQLRVQLVDTVIDQLTKRDRRKAELLRAREV